ncbi:MULTISPECIES: phage tail tape measure protein [Serratia]|uniref:phage tail tape measure protein n=1 Tax=Serratia TaxID=613 RepID=UPI00065F80F3|nr:phage tail tape measure protein [Serratia sp. 506_PEND]
MAREFDTEMKFSVKDDASTRIRSVAEDMKRMTQAREILGVRAERTIQREISQTIAAYNRAARSGQLSAAEQARAFDQMQSKVAKLNQELGKTERTYTSMAKGFGRGAVAIGGGLMAGAAVLRKPVEQQMDYSQHLATLSNFAFSDQNSVAARIAGKKELDSAIRNATQKGGTPDEAINALDIMLRSGTMNRQQAEKALPDVMKIGAATETNASDVAMLERNAYNFGLSQKDTPVAMSAITTAAQHGSLDFKVLAAEMPRGLESAKSAGFTGRRGFAQVPALFEASAIGAGSPNEAATNANDLLAELTSKNLAHNAKKMVIQGKGVDIQALEEADARKGLTPLDTVNHLVDTALKHDAKYQRLTQQLSTTKDQTTRDRINSQRSLIEGTYVSHLFPNQQARNAFINLRRNWGTFQKMQDEQLQQFNLPDGQRSVDLDYGVQQQENAFKVNQAKNSAFYASNDAMQPVAKVLGDISSEGAKLAQEFPNLAAAASGATTAIKAMAVAAIGFSGLSMIMGGLKGGAAGEVKGAVARGGILRRVGTAGAELASDAGKGALKWGGRFLRGGGLFAEGYAAYQGAQDMPLFHIQRGKDQEAEARAKAGPSDPELMKLMPKPAGALDVLDEIKQWFSGGDSAPGKGATAPAPIEVKAPNVNVSVFLDGQQLTANVQQRIERDSRRQ